MAYRIVDIECYTNYFLLLALDSSTGTVYRWELHNDVERGRSQAQLRSMLGHTTTITFNGLGYDWWMLSAYLQRLNNISLKQLSDWLIKTPMAQWNCEYERRITPYKSKHLDIMAIAPLVASLKIYAGRLNAPKLQDLPVQPHTFIDEPLRDSLVEYCVNDLHATDLLYKELRPQIKLRYRMSRQYVIDLRSKSDAAIAETVIRRMFDRHDMEITSPSKKLKAMRLDRSRAQYENRLARIENREPCYEDILPSNEGSEYDQEVREILLTKRVEGHHAEMMGKVPDEFQYRTPECVVFSSPEFAAALSTIETITFHRSEKGSLLVPPELRKPVRFNGRAYKMGIGGLHSTEKAQTVIAQPGEYLTDLDVTSYYPQLILTNEFYPAHISRVFLEVYNDIVQQRIAAKVRGDTVTADSLKIVINSSFGKFGNKYSALYSPRLLLQTTVSGQLFLMMLIEQIENNTECKIVSANTDGITVHSPNERQYAKMHLISAAWMRQTQMQLEAVQYKAVYSQDVNNYMAIKTDGSHKGKGLFAPASLSKNPHFPIIASSVATFFKTGKPVEDSIRQCHDIRQFVALRKVTGGALYRDDEVGSTVRWYLSRRGSPILYRKNANRVPDADRATLVNQLPDELPDDIDYEKYTARAYALIAGVGAMPLIV